MVKLVHFAYAAAAAAVLAAPPTSAAPLTTTPDTVYLFVAVLPALKERAPYEALYQTTDKAACESQAADWTTRLAPAKFACLPHAQKKLKDSSQSSTTEE